MLGYFKGRLLNDFPLYSRGTRQFAANYSAEHKWWEKHRIWIGGKNPPDEDRSYSEWLSTSVFCFSFMGEDATPLVAPSSAGRSSG